MSRRSLYIPLLLLLTACVIPSARSEQRGSQCDSIPEGAKRLIEAYPTHIVGYEDNMIIFADGERLVYDDGKQRSTVEMHIEQDVEDIFYQEYDTRCFPPAYGYDPGRYRSAALFDKIYGRNQEEVIANLVKVAWCPSFGCDSLLFSRQAGAAEALKRVSDEFELRSELREWVVDAQTFCYRNIAGTNRRSPHSYGFAIDISVAKSHYWRWAYPYADEYQRITYFNNISLEVVEIFEKHGFIWGGRWYHFDTMHFEYRPEINPPKSVVQKAVSRWECPSAISEMVSSGIFDGVCS